MGSSLLAQESVHCTSKGIAATKSRALQQLTSYDCKIDQMGGGFVKELDKCYHVAIQHDTHTKDVLFRNSAEKIETGRSSSHAR